jgi:5-methylcytosine-specific restriction endonuclease McrA
MTKAKRKRNRQKALQFKHQNGLCCWCLKPMVLHELTPEELAKRADYPMLATWEHLVPKAWGGDDSRWNRVLAHRVCNNKRGTKILEPHFGPFPRNWRGASSANC